MGTEKRERQKANRAAREAELSRARARSRTTRIALIVGGAIVAVFVLAWVAGRFVDDDDETPDDPATQTDTGTDTGDDAGTGDGNDEEGAAAPAPGDGVVADEAAGAVPDGCPPVDGTDDQTQEFDEAPPFCLDPTLAYSAVIETNLGDIEVDLDQEQAPNTVNSFVFLARNRYFDDTICHRVLVDFVAQCGDPTATGTGGPGYTTSDELPEEGAYRIGSLAMANSGPDTQGSQFFMITGDNGAALPPLYSLFGQVTDDSLEVLAEINARGAAADPDPPTEEVRIVSVTIETSTA